MKRGVAIGGLLFAALLLVWYFRGARPFAHGSQEEKLPTLRVSRATLIDSTVAIGTIKTQVGAEVKVGSQLSGVVSNLRVSVGDKVSKGDLLASLDDSDWRARVAGLEAQLASAVAERDYARNELARTERLGNLIPLLQIDNTRKNLRVKEAEVAAIRATLSQAKIALGYTIIKAPVSGTIASVSTNRGETIAASLAAPTFVTIVDLDRLEVQSYVDETDIGRVQIGQRVTFRVDAFPASVLEGRVQAIYPKAQLVNNVVDYVVIIGIVDVRALLIRPEMTVHVNFILDERKGVVAIPRSALLRVDGRNAVIVRVNGQWIERPVQTGLQTSQKIEIAAGLKEGETIIADRQAWKENEVTRNDRIE